MSTAEPSSIAVTDARPLQTFIAPVEGCPIPLSVLWMPLPRLPQEWTQAFTTEGSTTAFTKISCDELLLYPRVSHNRENAIRYFLRGIITSETQLNTFFLNLPGLHLDAAERIATYNRFLDNLVILDQQEANKYLSISKNQAWHYVSASTLFDVPVVITRSPPTQELLGKLLSVSPMGVGTYVGLSILPPEANPFLLLACVPLGIICMSTAAGVGRALQDGLYQRLLRLIEDTPKPRNKKR